MKKFINKIKNNKVLSVLSVLIIGLFFILVTRITYAYLAPVINDAQTNVVGSTDTVDDFKFELGNPLKINATPTTLKENGSNYTTSTTAKALLKANSTKKTATYNYYIYLQIKSNTFTYSDGSTPEIILTVTNPNGDEITSIDGLTYGTFNGVSGFDITTKKGLFNIANNHEITSNSSTTYTTQSWTIKITYLNLSIDQSTNFGNSMGVNVLIRKSKVTFTDYVILQYTGTQGENNIYYHDSNLANGAGDNSYRYAGPSDTTNNFVCFGSDEATCPTDNLYRIIGVIDNKVKLIKYDYATSTLLGKDGDYYGSSTPGSTYKGSQSSIDRYYWNYKASGNASNVWSTSLLNKTNLNTNFINKIGSTWAGKIATTTWQVGGNTFAKISEVVPATAYKNEVGSSASRTIVNKKIGLMYVSDYYYAASPSAWTLVGYNSSDSTKDYRAATGDNWMYMGYLDWTISRDSDNSISAFNVDVVGCMFYNSASGGLGVRPSFNLESTVAYVSGSGSMSDPIRVS